MADRRSQQNFEALPHYLTAEIWDSFQQLSRERCSSLIMQHLWLLGLRCPSEATFNVIGNLLDLACPSSDTRSVTTYQKYCALQKLKEQWRKYKVAKKRDDKIYNEYLELLPESPADLPAEYLLSAFGQSNWVECRASLNNLDNAFPFGGAVFNSDPGIPWVWVHFSGSCWAIFNSDPGIP
eukprot:Skav225798  [mRNA]  locus=scaffold4213:11531:12073:+ [translate_table: standard]